MQVTTVAPKFGEPLKPVTVEEGQKAVIEGEKLNIFIVSIESNTTYFTLFSAF